ncbi:MAG: sugar ABC transporter ATP-binding protein [Pseudonocardia sp.]|nr:sugar ABC transporter ATP-binding protein [Pseudonocardia sp.]
MTGTEPEPAIQAEAVDKRYGAVQALREASFAAHAGEVHALVGENGAGKSTLIKVLCGVTRPDGGAVRVAGEPVELAGPADAAARGVVTAFQELTLLPYLSVAENLLLGREPRGGLGLIRRRELAERARAVLAEFGVESIDPAALVETLPLAQQQIVEVVRAVSQRPKVLLLDEPTSALAEREVEWLFDLVRELCRGGTCVIFTSHRWREVAEIADRITVFRGGTEVATSDALDEDEAIRLMTGRAPAQAGTALPTPGGGTVLRVSGLAGGRLRGVDLEAGRGEIVGVGGLAGQGQRELFLALFGLGPASGEISVDGTPVRLRGPRDAIRAGIALVPEDRKAEGLFPWMSIRENLTLPVLTRIAGRGVLRPAPERVAAAGMIETLGIGARDQEQPVRALSGGNQQKVLLGRWLLTGARVVLLYDVTRGVDVGTKRDIFDRIAQLAGQGVAVLFYSSETEEVARMSHRVVVLREGRIAAELARAPGDGGIDPERIVAASVREPETPLVER